jgi:hypothetical protein
MPIYQYKCLDGHITEKILTISEMERSEHKQNLHCDVKVNKYGEEDDSGDYCDLILERIPSVFNTAQVGKPSIIFRNLKTGELQNATSEYQAAPRGFVKEELKGPFERSKFEKEYNTKMDMQDDIVTEEKRQRVSENQKARQDKLKRNLSKIAGKSDNPSTVKSLMKSAMERNRKKERVSRKKTNFRFEVN